MILKIYIKSYFSQTPLAHACNTSYSAGRDQENHCWKLAWANGSRDPISKISITKTGWWSDSRCRPWVQAPVSHTQKKSYFIQKNTSKPKEVGSWWLMPVTLNTWETEIGRIMVWGHFRHSCETSSPNSSPI
jgi:hypothetical protein